MATVSRVLPWRRSAAPPVEVAPVVTAFGQRHPKASADLIARAYEYAAVAHADQFRRSGEPYINHPLAVGRIVADLGVDDTTIAAALLHDVVEDTGVTGADIETEFGPDVAAIVDGVTKLDGLHFESRQAQQAATLRKMLVAMASDLRVLIIKLADRLHNMRTLAALPAAKQERIANETLEIYAPLAHRLGMSEVKQQLEDLSFATLHPKRYAEIDAMVFQRAPERVIYLEQIIGEVDEHLAELGIRATVTGRPKHLWSIYEKMVLKGRDFEDIFDLVGIRVTVDSIRDCYAALGSIHATWKPVQGRFKDYIAMPKFNLYQSLHTTVIGPLGKTLEVQIRTQEMHDRAEFGAAAHFAYKDKGPAAKSEDMPWLNGIVDWQAETSDPNEFMDALRVTLDSDEVYVFTPQGEILTLSQGSTPVDFAYAIHTEVGHACVGAQVNGRLVSLDHRLQSGDTCAIVTSKSVGTGPSRDWLGFVATQRAASKIRQWFSRERREDAIDSGRDELHRALRRQGLPVQKLDAEILEQIATGLNYVDVDSLYVALGQHHISGASIAAKIGRQLRGGDPDVSPQKVSTSISSHRPPAHSSSVGVHVDGLDDVMIRLARCCTPMPGDEIVGFVTRGRGISVHRADCANALGLEQTEATRLVDVEWDLAATGMFLATVEVKALDRTGLLRDVSTMVGEHHVNILSCAATMGSDRVSKMRFDFELGDPSHLSAVVRSIKGIDGVYDAYRVLPGSH
ncbi:MAG: bifunctional (p)ppGpp synthetase/guanosine-3',5'-bis(diphosphate) 3'-pyrophosphohydrolase [Actinobacteria bacterium]|nr:bifunctional (p)ppGpp synthetase/guanosine-3',5'-bis(diphosphate) 3'-pyrophosphohydrolase [Actinomycetota bacterium]